MRISLASDHAGYEYKEAIKGFLRGGGHKIEDFGTDSTESCDYPIFIRLAAEAVASGQYDRGIVLGGSGNGEAICANKVVGIRCALCWNTTTATLARSHNNANMLSIGQRMVALDTTLQMVRAWLDTPFEGGRHQRRIDQLESSR